MPRKAEKFQNNLNTFSKEREITDTYFQRKSLQFWRQNVCNCKFNGSFEQSLPPPILAWEGGGGRGDRSKGTSDMFITT